MLNLLLPLVSDVVLEPMTEKQFREWLFVSLGNFSVFWSSPIGIWNLPFILVALGAMTRLWKHAFPSGTQ